MSAKTGIVVLSVFLGAMAILLLSFRAFAGRRAVLSVAVSHNNAPEPTQRIIVAPAIVSTPDREAERERRQRNDYVVSAFLCTDAMRQGIQNLVRVDEARKIYPPRDEWELKNWAKESAISLAFLSGAGEAAAKIRPVPESCYPIHRRITALAVKAAMIPDRFISEIRYIAAGYPSAAVGEAQQMVFEINAIDAELRQLKQF